MTLCFHGSYLHRSLLTHQVSRDQPMGIKGLPGVAVSDCLNRHDTRAVQIMDPPLSRHTRTYCLSLPKNTLHIPSYAIDRGHAGIHWVGHILLVSAIVAFEAWSWVESGPIVKIQLLAS